MVLSEPITIQIDATRTVSGLLQVPPDAIAAFVFAHGAGAGMTHPFMAGVADGLAERRIATVRYQFAYMQAGSKRPDRPPLAHAAVRAAVAAASRRLPSLPLFAGGKSFGARMTSQAQAESPLPRVGGLIFAGFPLHPAKKPSDDRGAHLALVRIPMLFLQGTRDALAEPALLLPLIARLGGAATLCAIEQADHSFHVPARSGRTDAQVLAGMCDTIMAWIAEVLGSAGSPPRTAGS
nr:alpha/beta family hydrolase [uncultured Rhodopila sp.]